MKVKTGAGRIRGESAQQSTSASARLRSSARSGSCRCRRRAARRRAPAASASSVGTEGASSPVRKRWKMLREVVTPSAPALTASAVSRRISARSAVGRRLEIGAALAHDEDAQRRMRQLGAEVDVRLPLVERVEIVREALPVERHALGHDDVGNVLDAFHQLDQSSWSPGRHRREADAAIAHHHRRHAVDRGRLRAGSPR